MKEEIFYILMERGRFVQGDYYLERIFELPTVISIIEEELSERIIISNDEVLLSKYIVVINEDEFKMLCNLSEFKKQHIRLSKDYFKKINKEVYSYFLMIKDFEIVSANTTYSSETLYPFQDDPTICQEHYSYEGWVINKEFDYFKTPERYNSSNDSDGLFFLKDVQVADLEKIKELVNVNVLSLGNETNPDQKWHFEGEYLKYFDQVSSKRIYIKQESLDALIQDKNTVFDIDTRLDKDYFIEYYVLGIHNLHNDSSEEYYDSDENASVSD